MAEQKKNKFPARASIIVLLGTLTSRFFGFFREIIIAAYFGSGMAVDAFQAAYAIPNFFLQLFGSATISSAFIPVIIKYISKDDKEGINIIASSAANFLFIFFLFFTIIGIVFAPVFAGLIAPGYLKDTAKFNLTVLMTRIMFPAVIFLGIAGFIMGMLHAYNHFAGPAFAPIFFNIFIILLILILNPSIGPLSLAFGIVAGTIFQLLFQLPFLKKRGWKYSFVFAWRHPEVRKMGLLMLPIVFSLASIELNVFVDTRFASLLKTGSVAALHYALRIWYLPLGLFSVTISTVLFPMFSKLSAAGDLAGLKKSFSTGLKIIFTIMMPVSIGFIILATPIIRLAFMRGAFDMEAVAATSYAFIFYSIGLTSSSALHLINRLYYSLKDTLTPTIVTILSIVVNYIGNWILIGPLKQGGIALSTSLVLTFNFFCLFIILRKKIGQIGGYNILITFIKISIASLFFGIAAFSGWKIMNSFISQSTAGQFLSLSTAIFLATGVYLLIARYLKIGEITVFSNLVRERFGRLRQRRPESL